MTDSDSESNDVRIGWPRAISKVVADEEPATKKLRSMDPDLKIVVKERDDSGNVTSEKEYSVYAQVFARYSKIVDTSLSVDMKEKETREIIFYDVSPDTYEQAIKYLDDPLANREMKIQDVFKVLEFYDKYEFTGGLKICDQIIYDFINKYSTLSCVGMDIIRIDESNLDLLVKGIVAANSFNLKAATKRGIDYFREVLFPEIDTKFSVDHIRQMQPFLIRHDAKTNLSRFLSITQEELESALFPKYFVEWQTKLSTQEVINAVSISGTGTSVDGVYEKKARGRQHVYYLHPVDRRASFQWSGRPARVVVSKDSSDRNNWAIVVSFFDGDNEEIVLWECHHSSNLLFPPKALWRTDHHSTQQFSTPVVRALDITSLN